MKLVNSLIAKIILVFLFFFLVFLAAHLRNSGLSTSDDPYYHAKHASLMAESGNLTLVKPWLEFHFFGYAPTDPWWGFHLGMALFIYLFGQVLGVKIFASFLAALVMAVFYFILRQLNIKYASVWTALLVSASSIFSFRLMLERPHLLSMIAFPLAIYFLIKQKNVWLFFLTLFYTLSYHLAPLVILLAGVYLAADAYKQRRINLRPLIAAAGGVLAGIMLHPESLNYLNVIYIHLGRVLVLKFAGVNLNIGSELQMISFADFLRANLPVIVLSLAAAPLYLAIKNSLRQPAASDFLFLYSSLWFMVALLVPRAVEYWLPAAVLFAAMTFKQAAASDAWRRAVKITGEKVNWKIINFFLISATAVFMVYNLINVFGMINRNNTAELAENFYQANVWLKSHSRPGEIVFYDNWGMWPMMFYFNDYNHYIAGMEPTLLYEYDKRTYWLWRNLSSQGLTCGQSTVCLTSPASQLKNVPDTIKNVFRARYAVLQNNPPGNLIKTLNSLRGRAKLVFKNPELVIYEIL